MNKKPAVVSAKFTPIIERVRSSIGFSSSNSTVSSPLSDPSIFSDHTLNSVGLLLYPRLPPSSPSSLTVSSLTASSATKYFPFPTTHPHLCWKDTLRFWILESLAQRNFILYKVFLKLNFSLLKLLPKKEGLFMNFCSARFVFSIIYLCGRTNLGSFGEFSIQFSKSTFVWKVVNNLESLSKIL